MISYLLTPLILAIGNRLRGDDCFPPSTTLKRIMWWAIPFTLCTVWVLGIPYYAYWFIGTVFVCAWICYAGYGRPNEEKHLIDDWFPFLKKMGKMEMENPKWMTIYGIGRGIILAFPFILHGMFTIAMGVIAGFAMQGIAFHLGKKITEMYRPAIFVDEFTEWGEILAGFFIGVGLICGKLSLLLL